MREPKAEPKAEPKIERKIKCPQCGLFTIYSLENLSRPFCSARCKLIDLGEWASESYKVPTPHEPGYQEINSDEFSSESDKED